MEKMEECTRYDYVGFRGAHSRHGQRRRLSWSGLSAQAVLHAAHTNVKSSTAGIAATTQQLGHASILCCADPFFLLFVSGREIKAGNAALGRDKEQSGRKIWGGQNFLGGTKLVQVLG